MKILLHVHPSDIDWYVQGYVFIHVHVCQVGLFTVYHVFHNLHTSVNYFTWFDD